MTGRPRPWLWLLAWVFMVLLCRATWAGYTPPVPLEGTWASPFEDHDLYECQHELQDKTQNDQRVVGSIFNLVIVGHRVWHRALAGGGRAAGRAPVHADPLAPRERP